MGSTKNRILVIGHGHPDFSKGGAEIAAFNLFKAYRQHPDVSEAFLLARHHDNRAPTGRISPLRKDEFLWEQSLKNDFLMEAANISSVIREFSWFIKRLKPDVVHIHHFAHMGLEYFKAIKNVNPDIRIMMTLHEYLPICYSSGQMVKRQNKQLCFRESFIDCHRCFPERSIEDFWLRKHRYKMYFRMVEKFIAPSEFLRQRYIDWGIEPGRIVTIENGHAERKSLPPRPLDASGRRNRFGYFGQVNPFKGMPVILRALMSLPEAERKKIVFEVHGANFENQAQSFQDEVNALRGPLEKEGVLHWIGPYEPHEMGQRLANIDWVTVPSIWWENSPMVIQEAFCFGRPLVVSDIGGMAEKVTDGVNGLHVATGNAAAWGQTMLSLATNPETWDKMAAGIIPPDNYMACADKHLALLNPVPQEAAPVPAQ